MKRQPRVQEIGMKKRGKREGKGNPEKEETMHPKREYTKRQVTRIAKKKQAVQGEMATKSTNTMGKKDTIKTYGKGGKKR